MPVCSRPRPFIFICKMGVTMGPSLSAVENRLDTRSWRHLGRASSGGSGQAAVTLAVAACPFSVRWWEGSRVGQEASQPPRLLSVPKGNTEVRDLQEAEAG